jgi:predicted  nucleic acid-binding Zn-ribbon protein
MIRTSVILPLILIMLDKDIAELEQSKQTFRPYLVRSAQLLRDRVNADLVAARRELNKSGIKVIEEESPRSAKRWKITGSEETLEMTRAEIRADIDERIAAYNEGMFNEAKPLGHVPVDKPLKPDGTR